MTSNILNISDICRECEIRGSTPSFSYLKHLQAIDPSFATTVDFLHLGYPLSRIFSCLEQKPQSLEYLKTFSSRVLLHYKIELKRSIFEI